MNIDAIIPTVIRNILCRSDSLESGMAERRKVRYAKMMNIDAE